MISNQLAITNVKLKALSTNYRIGCLFGIGQVAAGRDGSTTGAYEFVIVSQRVVYGVLLDPAERRVHVGKGKGSTGQKKVRYARDKYGDLETSEIFKTVRKAILTHGKVKTRRFGVGTTVPASSAASARQAIRLCRGLGP